MESLLLTTFPILKLSDTWGREEENGIGNESPGPPSSLFTQLLSSERVRVWCIHCIYHRAPAGRIGEGKIQGKGGGRARTDLTYSIRAENRMSVSPVARSATCVRFGMAACSELPAANTRCYSRVSRASRVCPPLHHVVTVKWFQWRRS